MDADQGIFQVIDLSKSTHPSMFRIQPVTGFLNNQD